MIVTASVQIDRPPAAVWALLTDLDAAAAIVSGIERIEVTHRPAHGLVGLRWRETRRYFGELATVEKTLTEAAAPEHLATQAERDGFRFTARYRLRPSGAGTELVSAHETRPLGLGAWLRARPLVFFKGAIRKALQQDLDDLRRAAEQRAPG